MTKITLTKIFTTDKDKLGNPLKSSKGAPYTRMSIKCNEYGDQWISGFKGIANKNWKEGDTVTVEIKEVEGKEGKIYLNFEVPKNESVGSEGIEKVLNMLTTMNLTLLLIADQVGLKKDMSTGQFYKNTLDLRGAQTPNQQKTAESKYPANGDDYDNESINPDDIPF